MLNSSTGLFQKLHTARRSQAVVRKNLKLGALITLMLVGTIALPARQEGTLLAYIQELKWDSSAHGPLLAIDPDQTYRYPDGSAEEKSGPEAYDKKLVKVGGVSIFAPFMRAVEEEPDPNQPWKFLSPDQKIWGLIANLSQADFERLNQSGLCADDLRGDARVAFLSLLPHKIDLLPGVVQQGGATQMGEYTSLPDEYRSKLKLQVCRGIDVSLSHKIDESSSVGGASFTSLDLPKPVGTNVITSSALEEVGMLSPGEEARRVEAEEKEYRFGWKDPRLAQEIPLNGDETVGSVVDRIRETTQIEIYVDARMADFKLHTVGATGKCGDVLRAIVLALDGVIRQVGPAFVIAENLEAASLGAPGWRT